MVDKPILRQTENNPVPKFFFILQEILLLNVLKVLVGPHL